jgi:iron complex outermembrane receptor protein
MTDTGLFASLAVAAGIPRSEYLPDDFWTTSQDFEGLNKLELWGISGHLDFEINETLHLKSITTYRDTFNHVKQDQDSLTLVLAHDSNWVNYDQFTQELQLIGSIDRWKWMAGFFYLDLDERRQGGNEFSFIVPGLQRLADGRNSVETLALYANATFDITDQLSIEAGLRYTYEEKGGSFEQWGVPDIIPSFNRLLPEDFRDWNDWSPKVGLNYKPIDDVLLYGVVSKGFKSGFKVPTNPVDNPWIDPEKLWNYEVGIKSDWFDDRLRVNGSFFYYDYTDMQIRTFFVPPSG